MQSSTNSERSSVNASAGSAMSSFASGPAQSLWEFSLGEGPGAGPGLKVEKCDMWQLGSSMLKLCAALSKSWDPTFEVGIAGAALWQQMAP